MKTILFCNNRFPSVPVWLFAVVAVFFVLGSGGAERDERRSDVLTFQGDRQVAPSSLPGNSFHVLLNRRSASGNALQSNVQPAKYAVILRSVDPVERALFQDAENGRWEQFDLFRAAMVAEGIRDIEFIRTHEARLDALVAQVTALHGNTSAQNLTRALFEAMHKELLTQPYDLHCTELSKVMLTGHFNCVSATILFNCLAEKAGINVTALEMPGHALSRVYFAGGVFTNIETTCPTWFNLQSEHERHQATLARIAPSPGTPTPPTGQNAVSATAEPPADLMTDLMANHREITPVQLVATVYYNIGVDLLAKAKYPEAAAANVRALYLDQGNEQAWNNLLVSLNNWAIDAAGRDKQTRLYDLAAFLLDQGVALDPGYEKFRANYTFVFHDWIRELALLGRFEDARKVFALANAPNRIPNNEHLIRLMNEINQSEQRLLR